MTDKQKFNTELSSMFGHSALADRLSLIQRARILYLARLKFGNSIWDADAFVEAKKFIRFEQLLVAEEVTNDQKSFINTSLVISAIYTSTKSNRQGG